MVISILKQILSLGKKEKTKSNCRVLTEEKLDAISARLEHPP
jgi:hypothetical protein